MTVRRNVTASAASAAVATALLLTSCAGPRGDEPSPAASPSAAAPHGYVEGAEEAPEQQSRLLLHDPAGGDGRVLDLTTGTVHRTASVNGAVRLGTDGRFGYLHTTGTTHVVDSGVWTVDHGDHAHYYRAAVRDLGDLLGGPEARVRGDAAVVAVTDGEGRARLYDRTELEEGRIGSPRTLPGTHAAAVLPYAEHLVTLRDADGTTVLSVLDREGGRVDAPRLECDEPRGDAVTGRGAVLGCADGALLVREQEGAFTAEKIPYDEAVPAEQRAAVFHRRPGSDTLTARAGDRAAWVLDVTERKWTRVETGPVLAVNTAGEGSPLLVLETDGALHGYDIGSGEEVARTEPLLTGKHRADDDGAGPVIEVDRSRSYLNDPEGKRVHEIDHHDDLRVARTFDVDIEPHLMAETGR